jgi:hypothetical protein
MNGGLLIPILVPLGFFAMIFGIVYLQKKENLAMIEKDMNPRNRPAGGPEPFRNLKWGLLLVGSGLGLFLAYILDLNIRSLKPEALYFSLIAVGGGSGLIISYRLEMQDIRARRKEPEGISAQTSHGPQVPSEL